MLRRQIPFCVPLCGKRRIPGLLDELFDQALPSGVEDIQVAKDRIYAMSALILAAIDEQVGGDHDFPAAQTFEQRLYRTGNLGDFKKELKSILNELIEYKKTQDTASTSSSRMEEIKQYILHHYTENELTAAAIAAEFKMSSSYLSRAFKESTGTNILDYIQRLRVTQPKNCSRPSRSAPLPSRWASGIPRAWSGPSKSTRESPPANTSIFTESHKEQRSVRLQPENGRLSPKPRGTGGHSAGKKKNTLQPLTGFSCTFSRYII